MGDEIGLARRESATLGSRHLGLARALVDELPCTLAHLTVGTVCEWGATLLAKETAVLDPDDRRRVDAELADRLATMTPRQIERAARAMALAIDSRATARRRARATVDRRVTIRPQPDTMAAVSGLLPVEQGVAAWAALRCDAEAAKAAGDDRGLGQLMADLFVERLTGQAAADAVPVEVQLVMSPGSLLGLDDLPAALPGHGPLPAGLARDLVLGVDGAGDGGAGDGGAGDGEVSGRAWLRRIFTDDVDRVVATDPHRRSFPASLRRLLRVRDGVCRFPFCDAPIRHDDHVVAVALGGATTAHNGQGLCARHNLTKARPGWRSATVEARAGGASSAACNAPEVVTLTPTGHRYGSPVPPVLERLPKPSLPDPSTAEARLLSMLPCRDRTARRRRRVDVLRPDATIELLDTG
ncbi:hypothetical protein B277_11590 [Janibacter hoylei PVAS-1]|uniref:HNH endonuclease n=1 Tax=Janibacter hoylei PVAS-1 TaxID=1210046 RepID=K1E5C3_9MICO|nr:HNH endonuclease signature motif containing protein [Janibacter hoylei]EKA60617.1 hypothetical protein B277_11590 [Janibacter hoylei PVAS-1]RWU81503.1 HNH endonuclease [Janibacter hoylei PVAS-1]